jgi:hypothetical protein
VCEIAQQHDDGTIFHTYVDDGIFYHAEQATIDKHINDLTQRGFDIEVEQENLPGYLGVQIDPVDNDTLHLSQTGLIDRIILALNLDEDSTKRYTPATATLGADKDGPPPTCEFNYRSVVGMLMYLANNTRPELCFAVHQCARFSASPRQSHEKALKHIGRYLLATRDKGIYIRSSDLASLDCYVDADFAGLWNVEPATDPTCVRSRTGFIIMLGGMPIVWSSKLQTEIASSTMMAEYIALSMSMRTVIPLRTTLQQILSTLSHSKADAAVFKTTIHEDNNPALILANAEPPRLTPGSKHFAVKYHWFRQHLKPGELEVQ